jgi:hypothetical protein
MKIVNEGRKPDMEKPPAQKVDPVNEPPAKNSKNQGLLRVAINIFILFNLIVITCWALPLDISPLQEVKKIVRPYMLWTGLFQSWNFFAPNPKAVNSYIEAVAITQNHKQKVWVFPRMDLLSYSQRYREERYRKFAEVLLDRKNANLWPDVARHLAPMFQSRTDPPVMILLIEFQAPIQPSAGNTSGPIPKPDIFYEYFLSEGPQ